MSTHRRFFVDPRVISGTEATIVGATAHQITSVLRLTVGDRMILLDGSGSEHEAEIASISRGRVSARLLRTARCEVDPRLRLTLAVCLPKGDKFDLVVQKCTELGVSEIVAIASERTVTRIDQSRIEGRLGRWRRIATEAAEQCGRASAPRIRGIIPYQDLIEEMPDYGVVLLAWEEEGASLRNVLAGFPGRESVMLVVGPEGGLTEREASLAQEAGAKCVSLGRRILRCETAAIAVVAVIMYEVEGEL